MNGTTYAGRTTMVKMVAEKYNGIVLVKKTIIMLNCQIYIFQD